MKEIALAALGAVGFFALGLVTEAFTSWLAGRAADRARKEQRRLERQDRRDAFELETLRGLEVALEAYVMAETRRLAVQQENFEQTGVWASVDREQNAAILLATREVSRLRSRVFQEDLRQQVLDFQLHLESAARSPGHGMSDADAQIRAAVIFAESVGMLRDLDVRMGDRIRQLYEEPD